MNFDFCVIDGKTINDIVTAYRDEIYDLVRKTYSVHHAGHTVNPPSYFFRIPEKENARIIALPSAIIGEDKIVGMKWIGSNPDNIRQDCQRASATIILNHYDTFYPYACLEGSIISATRTAYSAVLAANEIRKNIFKTIDTLGIVGTGPIARYFYNALIAQGWQINQILVFDIIEKYGVKFINYLQKNKHNTVQTVPRLESLLDQSDMIVFATSALEPHVFKTHYFNHNPIVLNLSLRDLAPEIILASNNIVDDIEHVLQANTSTHLAYRLCGHKNFINGTIGDFIEGKLLLDPQKPTVFSPMGLGILDLALAYFIYLKALEQGSSITISNFFYSTER